MKALVVARKTELMGREMPDFRHGDTTNKHQPCSLLHSPIALRQTRLPLLTDT